MRLEIRGRVQGVFFRQTLREAADRLGLAGSAVNQPDGSVLAFFEGPAELVEEAVEVASSGPPAAQVERVDLAQESPTGQPGFDVG